MKHHYFRNITAICMMGFLTLFTTTIEAQLNTPRGSQKAMVKQTVGITDISINYSRPSVRGREVWGKLVPYGMNNFGFGTAKESPWRAGADENTVIKFTHDVTFEGKPIKAGKYGLHMVIKENGDADIILSKNHTAWGSYFYDPAENAITVTVKTKEAPHREVLTYDFIDVKPTSTTAALIWEKKQIPFKIDVPVTDIVITDIKKGMQGQAGFSRQNWEQAASFSLNNGGDLNEALQWVNKAREGMFFSQKTFTNAQLKAGILNKMGKKAESIDLMNKSLKDGSVFQVHGYARTLMSQGLNDEAFKVFKWNAANHKNTWPVNYGLGRGYASQGNNKTAIKYLTKALKLAPNKANKDRIQANIDRLKKGEKMQ